MNPLIFFLYCFSGAILNRLGGCSLNLPLKSKIRDWGVSLIGVMALGAMMPKVSLWGYYGVLVAYFLVSWASLSTYFDHWGTDGVDWYEWLIVGFAIGMSGFFVAIYTGSWLGFAIRTIILMIFMPFSNKLQFKVLLDKTDGVEGSRGFVIIATLPLLVI